MGRPLMIQEADDRRIEELKSRIGVTTKVAVVRAALDLLEQQADARARIVRWKRAARAAAATSREVNAEFRAFSRLRRS